MRVSWLIGALVTFVIGYILTTTIIGAILGIPLILISIIILFLAFLIPEKRAVVKKVINVHKRR